MLAPCVIGIAAIVEILLIGLLFAPSKPLDRRGPDTW